MKLQKIRQVLEVATLDLLYEPDAPSIEGENLIPITR